jgi:hypothetical protein
MPGYPFSRHAELAVENSDVHLTARLCELSREGCLLYAENPPLVGASVFVKIWRVALSDMWFGGNSTCDSDVWILHP